MEGQNCALHLNLSHSKMCIKSSSYRVNGGVEVWKYIYHGIFEFLGLYELKNVHWKFLIQNERKTFIPEAPSFWYSDLFILPIQQKFIENELF